MGFLRDAGHTCRNIFGGEQLVSESFAETRRASCDQHDVRFHRNWTGVHENLIQMAEEEEE